MTDVLERPTLLKRVRLHEPAGGWSGEGYDRALRAYAARHGRPPQTATMHPATATAPGVRDGIPRSGAHESPLVVTSPEYAGQTITLYY